MTIYDFVRGTMQLYATEETDYNITIVDQSYTPPKEILDYVLKAHSEIDNTTFKKVEIRFLSDEDVEDWAEYDDLEELEDVQEEIALIEFFFYV